MTDDNGFKEHKLYITNKLEEHDEKLDNIEKDINIINLATAPIPKLATDMEKLLLHQARAEGAAEATNTGVHQLPPPPPSTAKKIVNSEWFRLAVLAFVCSGLSIGGIQCGNGGCSFEGCVKESTDIEKLAATERSDSPPVALNE